MVAIHDIKPPTMGQSLRLQGGAALGASPTAPLQTII